MKPKKSVEKLIRDFIEMVELTSSSRILLDMVIDFIVEENLENRSNMEDLVAHIYGYDK